MDFVHPVFEFEESLFLVDGIEQEDCGYAFVEWAYDSAKEFLSCLGEVSVTVSQICRRTMVLGSICTILLEYSTPTVTLYCSENSPFM